MGSALNGAGDSTDAYTSPTIERGTWAMEYPRDQLPDLSLDQVLWSAFEHHARTDQANAATHLAPVRWSPLTFRLADQLDAMNVHADLDPSGAELLRLVQAARGAYPEDKGR